MALSVYLGLFTWNLRTGYIDKLASNIGLEFVGAVLKPGKWVKREALGFWEQYIDLVDVRRRNDELQEQLRQSAFELATAREEAAELERLRALLSLSTPQGWDRIGARVISHRLGSQASLESIMLDKGYLRGGGANTPVVTHQGVVGRILRAGPFTSSVLLLSDPSSRVAVISQENRTPGIVVGNGPRQLLEMQYVSLNAPVKVGELLVTSGLAGAYPKGLPVARITSIEHSDISLFLNIKAEPLASMDNLEEVVLLRSAAEEAPAVPADPATPAAAGEEGSAGKEKAEGASPDDQAENQRGNESGEQSGNQSGNAA